MGLSFHSLFSDKNISEGLYLEKPLDEREVRDLECLVYYRGYIEKFVLLFCV